MTDKELRHKAQKEITELALEQVADIFEEVHERTPMTPSQMLNLGSGMAKVVETVFVHAFLAGKAYQAGELKTYILDLPKT